MSGRSAQSRAPRLLGGIPPQSDVQITANMAFAFYKYLSMLTPQTLIAAVIDTILTPRELWMFRHSSATFMLRRAKQSLGEALAV